MTSSIEQPTIYIIGGPNGVGKTTFANEFLPHYVRCNEFLNADLIAAGLSPYLPESQNVRASQLMLERMQDLVGKRKTFAFETTLAARSYRQRVLEWKEMGYCASNDEAIIKEGLQTVKKILAENYVRPDEAEKVKSIIKERGSLSTQYRGF